MNMQLSYSSMKIRTALIFLAILLSWSGCVLAEDNASVDKAREALAKQDDDEDAARQLEEVFEAAEKNYSMLKKGGKALNYSLDYSYTADSRIELEVENNIVRNLDVTPGANHSFTNSFSFDYGILNNVTVNLRVPLSTRYDSVRELSITDFGDISGGLRWQPFPYIPGRATVKASLNISSKTGVSPYEVDLSRQLSTGSGTYSISTGLSISKIVDPVVLYSSVSTSYAFEQNKLNQIRSGQLLTSVQPGQSFSWSGGFSYSLSYDTSLSISASLSYNTETRLSFNSGASLVSQDQVSGSMNFSLGIRLDPTTIVNTSFGFGLTEDASDLSLGLSYPINIGAWTW